MAPGRPAGGRGRGEGVRVAADRRIPTMRSRGVFERLRIHPETVLVSPDYDSDTGLVYQTGTEATRRFGPLVTRPCTVASATSSPLRDFAHMDAHTARVPLFQGEAEF